MNVNASILGNFKIYDKVLSRLDAKEKKVLISLKMMYSIHMENIQADKNLFFLFKQLIRFVLKLITVPFYKVKVSNNAKTSKCAIIKSSKTEEYMASKVGATLISTKKCFSLNMKSADVYKRLFRSVYLLFRSTELNKAYCLALSHRLVDYLMVYHTIDLGEIKVVMMENDRTPVNMALIHLAKERSVKTVKYDNWLIDPVNHNDVYCEYYFYPSLYHKEIIQSFESNRELKFVEGGFAYWDNLDLYEKIKNTHMKKIVYFTQIGISVQEHLSYIDDIAQTINKLGLSYELIVKIHPRENTQSYKELSVRYRVVDRHDDIYALIAEADYCFSIFSTVSLEAKHILNNSFFINYRKEDFGYINYNDLGLDLIGNNDDLLRLFKRDLLPVSQDIFISRGNCSYPYTAEKLRKVFCDG